MQLSMKMISGGNLSRQLEDFMHTTMKWDNYWDGVLDTMEQMKDENFKTEGSALQINPRWAPLSVGTAHARSTRSGYYKKQPRNPGVLRWTGNLQENISRIKTSLSCAMIFNAKYAVYHQDGRGRKHRAMFEFSPKVKAEIMRNIQKQFDDQVGIRNARQSS